jgi:toxin ParE1/3/4
VKATFRPAAREDILRQYRYYLLEEDAEEIAARFLEAVQETIRQLCKHPRMGSPRTFANPALDGLRSWPVQGFPAIRIYYMIAGKTLRIVRVLHGKRDISSLLEDESAESQV